jgi:hypothetical protein
VGTADCDLDDRWRGLMLLVELSEGARERVASPDRFGRPSTAAVDRIVVVSWGLARGSESLDAAV